MFYGSATVIRFSTITILVCSLAACGGYDNQTAETEQPSPNTGNVLAGSELGSNTENLSQIRKPISISAIGLHADLQLSQAYAAQSNSSSNDFFWMIPVTNTSTTQTYCEITINASIRNSSGLAIGQLIESNQLHGQVKKLTSNGRHINSCLEPTENGYFLGVDTNIYSEATNIVFSSTSVVSSGFTAADVSLIPESYTITSTLNLQIRNNGTSSVGIGPPSAYIILHTDDTPLMLGYLYPQMGADPAITPGQNSTIIGNINFLGSSQKIAVYLNYDAAGI